MKRCLLVFSILGVFGYHPDILSTIASLSPIAQTTDLKQPTVLIIVYMAARNDLSIYAEKHVKQLLGLGSSDRVKIFVHLDLIKPNEPLFTRNFFVEKDKLIPLGDDQPMDSGSKDTLIDAASLAYNYFPAEEVVLVLWNHGTGPIEPKVASSINQWELWHVDKSTGKINLDQSIGYLDRFAPGDSNFEKPKGICFDDSTGSYMTIGELTQAIGSISENIIKKKFKIVACDACLMAGIDVFSPLQPYVEYFVASQEVELGLGYKYDLILEPLVHNKVCCGVELAIHFVNAFKEYYSPKIDFFTHCAIDLSYSEKLEINISNLAQCLCYGMEHQDTKSVKEAIRLSRHKKFCIRFNEPTYIDLGNFYTNLLSHCPSCELLSGDTKTFQANLAAILKEGLILIKNAVKANEVGSKHEQANGISIYFPEYMIHKSYRSNAFAQKTNWLYFLDKYIISN